MMSKTNINDNTYLVVCHPNTVVVYADPDGIDHGRPDSPADIGGIHGYPYKKVIREDHIQDSDATLETIISQTVNDVVCVIEGIQDNREENALKVEAALEANKEVHGGIDYQLEQEQEQ